MPEMQEIRRQSDGSIDMNFYKARAQALRRAQIAQMGRALQRHVLQLFAALTELIRSEAMRPAVARRGARQNPK
jgi:queuine/archaeosine tRNA-ribosyltransferase